MKQSDAIHYSMAEFSWIFFFLATGAALFFANQMLASGKELEQLQEKLFSLTAENDQLIRDINILNELLAEKQYGIVPCWKRPEAVIPQIMGTITIEGQNEILISRDSDEKPQKMNLPVENRQDAMAGMLMDLFSEELVYSRDKNCYLRLKIVNNTNSFHYYQEAADAAAQAGIVVVR